MLAEGMRRVISPSAPPPNCRGLTQPGHTGPSRTAATGEMTTPKQACSPERSLLFNKLAVNFQLTLNKYTVGILSFFLPLFHIRLHGRLKISFVVIGWVSS